MRPCPKIGFIVTTTCYSCLIYGPDPFFRRVGGISLVCQQFLGPCNEESASIDFFCTFTVMCPLSTMGFAKLSAIPLRLTRPHSCLSPEGIKMAGRDEPAEVEVHPTQIYISILVFLDQAFPT